MALTPLLPTAASSDVQVLSGVGAPTAAPANPALAAIYIETDANGAPLMSHSWNAVTGWTVMPSASADGNWADAMDPCGWEGQHNSTDHGAVAHTTIALPSVLTPHFSVASVSTNPVPFALVNMASGAPVVIGTGQLPPNAKFATAAQCSLVDTAAVPAPITSLAFAPTVAEPVALYAAIPLGGHANMPADGSGFMCHFSAAF